MKNVQQIRKGLQVLAAVRLLIVILFFGLMIFLQLKGQTYPLYKYINWWIIGLFLLTAFYLYIMEFLPPDAKKYKLFCYFQLITDTVLIEILILLTGGIESWFSFLLILVVIGSSIILGQRGGFIIASLGAILYGVLIDLQYYNYLPIKYNSSYDVKDFFYNLVINTTGLYMTAFLMGYLVVRLERTSESLQKRDIDLKELYRFHSEVIENIPSGLFTTDLQGRITFINKAGEQIIGKAREMVLMKSITEIFPFLELPLKLGRHNGKVFKGNEEQFIGMNISMNRDSQGRELGFIGTFQDLTNIIRMEEEIKRKDRLAAIGELSANIAHEIRNPLASIKNSIEMLKEGVLPDETKKRLMEIAIKEMDRLNTIVSDFLMYSNPKPLEKRLVNLSEIVNSVVEMVNTDTNITIEKDIQEDIYLMVDEYKIRQLIWNILINAVQASTPGSIVRVSLKDTGSFCNIKIRDYGEGIAENDLEKIFYPFFSTKKEGTGLGLAIAYRIVEEHGGKIEVQSTVGEGTEFSIYLKKEGKGDEERQ